jgi:hypothetical protein
MVFLSIRSVGTTGSTSCWFHEPHKGVHVFNVMFRHQQEQTISFLCLVGLNETPLVDWTRFDFCNTHVYILHSQF